MLLKWQHEELKNIIIDIKEIFAKKNANLSQKYQSNWEHFKNRMPNFLIGISLQIYCNILAIITYIYFYGIFSAIFGLLVLSICFMQQTKQYISKLIKFGKSTYQNIQTKVLSMKNHKVNKQTIIMQSIKQMVNKINNEYGYKKLIIVAIMIVLIIYKTIYIVMSLKSVIILLGGIYFIRLYDRNQSIVDLKLIQIFEKLGLTKYIYYKKEDDKSKLYKKVNQYPINPRGEHFINMKETEQITTQMVKCIGMKVLMEIQERPIQNTIIMDQPVKIQYTGKLIQINPERVAIQKEYCNKQLYKLITKQQEEKVYKFFDQKSFNYIELIDGKIEKQGSVYDTKQSMKANQVIIDKERQKIELKISQIRQRFQQKKRKQLVKYNKIGHHHELTKQQTENNLILVNKFQQIMHNLNYFVDLDPDTIIKNYKYQGKYSIIYSNFKSQTSHDVRILIRISAKSTGQHYYFSNPEWLPIFIEDIPSVIKSYILIKYEQLTKQRMKSKNQYTADYILANKETIQSTKVIVLNKYGKINNFDQTLSQSKFKFSQSLEEDYHVIWIISGNTLNLSQKQISFIKSQYKKGAGIFIWADNDPYYFDANVIIKQLGYSFKLQGNYIGQKILNASDHKMIQTFDIHHPVSSGFQTLYQGNTICYPTSVSEGFKVFAYNSNLNAFQPASIYKQGTASVGGIWIDTGFTKLFPQCHQNNRQEVIRYFINASLFIRKKDYL